MSTPVAFEVRTVFALASLYVFRMLGLFMVLPVLSLHGDEFSGATPFLLGVALGAYGLSQALLQIPFGMWSDRWGRKPVIVLGLLIFALGSLVAAEADSIYQLIFGRILQGGGAIAGAVMALVADLTTEEHRTKAMAAIGVSIGMSFSAAMVLGPSVAAWGGISAVFWLTVALALAGIVVLVSFVPTPARSSARSQQSQGRAMAALGITLKNPQLLRLDWGIFSLHMVLTASFVTVPYLLESGLGIPADQHWWVYLSLMGGAFVAMLPFIFLAERRRQMKTIFVSAVAVLGLTKLMLAQWYESYWLVIGALFLFFMAFNLLEACLPSLMSKTAPAESKGAASGIYSTSQFLGVFVGGAMGGWLLQLGGPGYVFGGCFVISMIWFPLALTMKQPRYLTSILVRVVAGAEDRLHEQLEGTEGLEELVVMASEGVAYLKVDSARFDRNKLKELQAALILQPQ